MVRPLMQNYLHVEIVIAIAFTICNLTHPAETGSIGRVEMKIIE